MKLPDDEWNKKRRSPFDDFFSSDIDDIFKHMEKMMNHFYKDFDFENIKPGKRFVQGYNIHIGPDGKPHIETFGNLPQKTPTGTPSLSEEREPLTDVLVHDKSVSVTVELPGVTKQDIDLNVSNNTLEIVVNNTERRYHKTVKLPCSVRSDSAKATYNNGILDICIQKQDPSHSAHRVPIN